MKELAASVETAKSAVPAALSSISREIGNAAPGIAAAFESAAGSVRSGSGNVARALADTGSALDGFKTRVTVGADTITTVADAVDKEARTATGMLKRLQELIENVTNFLRPGRS
jgi:hypothetical protein